MSFNIKRAFEIYEEEDNITRAAKRHCKEIGIPYEEKYRRRMSYHINNDSIDSTTNSKPTLVDHDLETEITTETNQYSNDKEIEEFALMPSAWDSEAGRFLDINEYCDKFGLPKESVRSSKLVAHLEKHMIYNIAFNPTLNEQTGIDEEFIESIIKQYITSQPKVITKGNGSNDYTDRLIITDIHIGMSTEGGRNVVPLYDGKWDAEEIFNRLSILIEHVSKYQKSNTIIVDELGDYVDGLFGQTTRKGHDLPQNMSDKECFDVAIKFKMALIETLLGLYDKVICNNITEDNHCFTSDVEVLTDSGFKKYLDVTKDDKIANMNPNNEIVYDKPLDYIYNEINNVIEIHDYKSKLTNISVTDQHRMYLSYDNKDTGYEYVLSKDVKKAPIKFKVAGSNLKTDNIKFSDDFIKLVAWINSDGTVRENSSQYYIYQSKPNRIKEIKKILNRLECGFHFRNKKSNTCEEIKGVQIDTNNVYDMYEFVLNNKWTHSDFLTLLREVLPTKEIPNFLNTLSKRQIDVYLQEYIKGDGTLKDSGSSATIYGTEEYLNKIQILCLINGHRAILTQNNRGDWVLCVVFDRDFVSFKYKNINKKKRYVDYTWCFTMPNSNLIVRKGGRVSVQGNSGVYGYFINSAVKNIVTVKYPDNVVYNICEKFINHYSVGPHTFILTHGKDSEALKFGFKPQLDAKQADKIDQYCKEYKLYSGNSIEFSKGDSHQMILDYTTSNDFDYCNYPAFSRPSNWVKSNFGQSRSGFVMQNLDMGSPVKVNIPYFFEK